MRLATFNILHGRSPEDGRVDVDRCAEAVASLDADVLGLQEVDRDQPRSGGADLTATAAEAMGAPHHRFVAALHGTPGLTWMAATGEEQPGTAGYGIALLSRYPVHSWQVVRLPALHGRVPVWSRGRRAPTIVADEPRVAVCADVESPVGRVTVAVTHLSFVPGWNTVQLRCLVRAVAGAPEPVVLMGDLNVEAPSAARTTRMRSLAAATTFPAHAPDRQLDHILVRGGLRSTGRALAPRLPVSDHRPLVVDVESAAA
ncbi:endonuclease/exonuclease/phosphatase family protein [Quadrisphaera sp. DSM 44207]|uniref:endonuclease/exonuclease/phosphatase family protein n=1 Tax=Quadrisphaera sp. DSM 44207 TaxID=1881057 RepID=UPI00088A7850|nr:endonuclease/exonuclease/phosphatase family protein [Quadrisphaera sp. DSM 44207]SDQ04035.1 Metal-dependent hydrolase, endonuclease/exonuclease/phosphatase family [Quadrisphaera sp. DSM 44207]